MNIQAEKIELAKLILETDNPNILGLIKSVFDKFQSHDFYNELTNEQKAEICLAIEQVSRGETIEYEEFMRKYR